MPPTDEEYLATARHAMMALEAQLYRSLGGPSPSRDQALAIAREMRDIVARAIALLGVDGAEEIVNWYERAGKRVVRELGTSAWDEPETVDQAKARMGTLPAAPGPGVLDRVNEREPAPPPEEELEPCNSVSGKRDLLGGPCDPCEPCETAAAWGRRLRSDEWLRAAALEIADKYESGTVSRLASAVMILRKHRDGKA